MTSDVFSITLLGTGTPLPNQDRASASTLISAGDQKIIIDTGRGFLNNLAQNGYIDAPTVMYTHYHSDHFAELGEFLVTRTIWGANAPLEIIGPVGAAKIVDSMEALYSLDNKYRKYHHTDKWHEEGMRAEVVEAAPGVVYDRGGLKATMFEVDHLPVEPAVGYRFDYMGKSIVISGDTKKVPQMIEMAKGCDILVHEALNRQLVEMSIAILRENNPRMAEMSVEMMDYHTSTLEAAEIAREAEVGRLVLTHLVPGVPPREEQEQAFIADMQDIFSGPILVGRDNMVITA